MENDKPCKWTVQEYKRLCEEPYPEVRAAARAMLAKLHTEEARQCSR